MPPGKKARPVAERFWEKVNIRGPFECWPWQASTDKDGYGWFGIGSRTDGSKRNTGAHRVAYEFLWGPLPDGLVPDHLCNRPACQNSLHLRAVSHGDNIRRGSAPTAVAARTGRCLKGHELSEHYGQQRCRICLRDYDREWKRRKRAAARG